tara:strand:+ start:348 stop:677 length:330 start_codon:yes stop_codon:yes gene_type:complete
MPVSSSRPVFEKAKPGASKDVDSFQRLRAATIPKMRGQGDTAWIVAICISLRDPKHRVSQDQMCERRMIRPEFRKDKQIRSGGDNLFQRQLTTFANPQLSGKVAQPRCS